MTNDGGTVEGIAIIGMAGRFPRAGSVEAFWENLCNGVDCISHFAKDELEFSVETEEEVKRGARFARARGILENAADFDAEFFGVPPPDAVLMDPQHRLFLECCWEALERAGHDPRGIDCPVGVYGGASLNTYLLYNLNRASGMAARLATRLHAGEFSALLGNDKDYLASRVAYKLGLRGPAMAVQSACSTSLVAVCEACTALQTFQCDMALAGGVSITFPQKRDYRFEDGGMASPDGVCRAFDAAAQGTVFSHGAGVVLLKRLSDALRDGDPVQAVVRGWAVNNDGRDRVGFAAPGLNGQAEVVAMAQAAAGVDPETISYIEAHGTGTALGDPVEVAALTKAFREGGANRVGFCALGTAKTHIGHLEAASGVAGLIKTVLQLEHGAIPPLLHFQNPHPEIRFESTPFFPVAEEIPWARGRTPRRAGVSSFGVGGTNAHVVLEEAPARESEGSRGPQALLLSARTPRALESFSSLLAAHFRNHPDLSLADAAFTLARSRSRFACRRAVFAEDLEAAARGFEQPAAKPQIADAHLRAAVAAWLGGDDLDADAHFPPEGRKRIALPTYPFERRRYWIDPGSRAGEAEEGAGETFEEAAPVEGLGEENLEDFLQSLIEQLAGIRIPDRARTFESLGLDSLFLAQVGTAVYRRTGAQITFRQLLSEANSISRLAALVEKLRPKGFVPEPARVAGPGKPRGSRLRAVRWPGKEPPGAAQAGRFGPYRPVEKGADGGLTARQKKALESLIARYTARTAASKKYAALHRPHFADPRAVSGFQALWKEMIYPIVSDGSKGSRIRDIDGNSYVDLTMGFGTYFFGHSPDWLKEALERRLELGIEIGPQSAQAGGIARDLCALTGMDRATFCNTGSEAVMAAMRVARAVTGRDRVVYFAGDYHGMFDEVLARGTWVDGEYRPQPIAPGIPESLVENMLVIEYGAPDSLEILRAHAREIAAVLVEPVQSRHTGLQPKAFLQELRDITARAGAALVFDEVVTGFRCHPGGAQAHFGVRADMATYGKIIGGGIPIGVLAGKREFLDALDGGAWNFGDDSFPEAAMTFFAGTFVRHPLAMAAARAVLDRLIAEGPGLQLGLNERADLLCRTVEAGFEAAGAPLRMSHFSACAGIEVPADLPYASLLWFYLREKGIHIWENRPIFLTLAHDDADMDAIVRAFSESVAEMQEGGFLPEGPAGARRIEAPRGFSAVDTSPVTEAQREILGSARMGDDANRAFNESVSIEFEGALDVAALEKALLLLVQRHPALRSAFSEDFERQVFPPAPSAWKLPVEDLRSLPPEARGERYHELLRAATGEPFDLARGPLLRNRLVLFDDRNAALVWTAHHLVCDGWSLGMLVDELSKSYGAFRAGRMPMLPPPMPFGEYARRMRGEEASEDARRDLEYWVSVFSGGAPVLELPTDRPRPPVRTFAGAMESLPLDPEVFERLKAATGSLGGTVFATLLAAFAALLQRLTGKEDLVIGVPSAGQTLVGCDELVGHCLNLLPLRLRMPADAPFTEAADGVRRAVLDAYERQGLTFGSLVRELRLPRDPSRPPLVSVMFNIDRSGFDHLHFDGLEFRVRANPKQFVNFDLFFNLVQSDAALEIECEYNTDLYEAATARRLLAAFATLISGVVEDASRPVSRLPLLAPDAREAAIRAGSGPALDYPRSLPVHGLFSKTAARFSGKTAVRCGEEALTYAELEERSDRIAARLREAGVRSGDLVGILAGRNVGSVAGFLGIWKSGAAYVPMDPAFPAQRLRWIAEDARMAAVLVEKPLAGLLPPDTPNLLFLDDPFPMAPPSFQPDPAGGEQLAYVIFTSGSTGRPKGVRVPHRAVVNFLESMRVEPGLTPDDVLLAVTTFSFDISVLELFLPLTTGATVWIARQESLADGTLLTREIEGSGATVMQATPSSWRLLLEAGWSGAPGMKILIGGEAVPREVVNALAPRCSSIWNMYGPTETTVWSATGRLEAGEGPVSIGRPIANTRIHIVSPGFEPQPDGVPGEIVIGGDGLALGYLGADEADAARFVPDPFEKGGRLYRTGDLGARRADGSLVCLGRMDTQAKVRGFRIELGEIEAHIEAHPAVAQAVCAVLDGRLFAFVRLEQPEKPDGEGEGALDAGLVSALREHLAARVPDYMTPAAFLAVQKFPLTPNGKVDRRALCAEGAGAVPAGRRHVAPRNSAEAGLAKIWEEALGLSGIGIEDDIFELGADSILIFQITARANRAGWNISPAQIFRERTISALSAKFAPGPAFEAGEREEKPIPKLDRAAYRRK